MSFEMRDGFEGVVHNKRRQFARSARRTSAPPVGGAPAAAAKRYVLF